MSETPDTLPRALAELDRSLVESAALRVKLANTRTELDNVYAMLGVATAQAADLAVEMAQAHAEREQLRDSVEATTLLVEELTSERTALRRRVEHMAGDAADRAYL